MVIEADRERRKKEKLRLVKWRSQLTGERLQKGEIEIAEAEIEAGEGETAD